MSQRMVVSRKNLILPLLIVASLSFVSVYAFVYEEETQLVTQTILNTYNVYDPDSDISTKWQVNCSETHFEAIDDSIRNTSIPILTDYICTSRPKTDEVGFPTPNESNIETITLWVYSSTGGNAKTTINLKNDGDVKATLTVNPSSPHEWRSATWQNPSSIGTITVEFKHTKQDSGKPTDSTIYAAYIEGIYNP